jgi:hypothetical protein
VHHHFLFLGFQRLERNGSTRLRFKFHDRGLFYSFYSVKADVVIRHERILSLFRPNCFTIPRRFTRKSLSKLAGQAEACSTSCHWRASRRAAAMLEQRVRNVRALSKISEAAKNSRAWLILFSKLLPLTLSFDRGAMSAQGLRRLTRAKKSQAHLPGPILHGWRFRP